MPDASPPEGPVTLRQWMAWYAHVAVLWAAIGSGACLAVEHGLRWPEPSPPPAPTPPEPKRPDWIPPNPPPPPTPTPDPMRSITPKLGPFEWRKWPSDSKGRFVWVYGREVDGAFLWQKWSQDEP
jgi:hypothetical protein